jgi:hypothetical protein
LALLVLLRILKCSPHFLPALGVGATNYLLSKWDSQGLEGILGVLAAKIGEEFILVDI